MTGHSMTVKVGEARSTRCPVNVGLPQGSVLDYIEEDCVYNQESQEEYFPNVNDKKGALKRKVANKKNLSKRI